MTSTSTPTTQPLTGRVIAHPTTASLVVFSTAESDYTSCPGHRRSVGVRSSSSSLDRRQSDQLTQRPPIEKRKTTTTLRLNTTLLPYPKRMIKRVKLDPPDVLVHRATEIGRVKAEHATRLEIHIDFRRLVGTDVNLVLSRY